MPSIIPAGTVPASQRGAARTGRIVLRREPTSAEVTEWAQVLDGSGGAAALITTLLASPEAASLDAAARAGRAWDAAFGRYDPDPPGSQAHWARTIALGDLDAASLPERFVGIAGSGYRFDPCASPVDGQGALFAVRDAAGAPLVFSVGENHHLYLFRHGGDGSWTQTDLSAALPQPAHGHVLSVDVQQAASGSIALAVAVGPRRGGGGSAVYAATGLSNALDADGWLAAMRALPQATGAPDGAVVSRVELAPQDGSSATLLLVGAAVKGITNTYHLNVAAPGDAWTELRIPEDADQVVQYAVGTFHRPGVWTLYRVAKDVALTFTTLVPDAFGKFINVSCTELPAGATGFHLAAGTQPGLPDVYVAGDGIVVYRGSHASPETVAAGVTGARLVWSARTGAAEHLAFVDSTQQLRMVSRPAGGAWSDPYTVTDGLQSAAPVGDPGGVALDVAVVTASGTLELRHVPGPGQASSSSELPLRAVWSEDPLSAAEMRSAVPTAAPVVWFDPDEEFQPSPVEFFLSRVGLWNQVAGSWQLDAGTLLDPATGDLRAAALQAFPRSDAGNAPRDSDYVLKLSDGDYPAVQPGSPDAAPFYVHAKFIPGENATDLVFWLFYPYNGAGVLKLSTPGLNRRVDLSPLGVHEGDWEHFTVRVDNDTMQPRALYLSAHDGGGWTDVAQVGRDEGSGQMVVYASRHGHAFYTQAGDNLAHDTSSALWDIGLVNRCGQGTRINAWDAGRTRLMSASCLGSDAPAEPAWLQLSWRWGRYAEFTRDQVAGVIHNVLGPVIGGLPFFSDVSQAAAAIMIQKDVLGGEGNSAGPGAIKFKDNWFGAE